MSWKHMTCDINKFDSGLKKTTKTIAKLLSISPKRKKTTETTTKLFVLNVNARSSHQVPLILFSKSVKNYKASINKFPLLNGTSLILPQQHSE